MRSGELAAEHLHQLVRLLAVARELGGERAAPQQVEHEAVVQPLVVADHDVVEHRQRQAHARALEGPGHARAIDRLRRRGGHVRAGRR
jgi:hypothetical protein